MEAGNMMYALKTSGQVTYLTRSRSMPDDLPVAQIVRHVRYDQEFCQAMMVMMRDGRICMIAL
jgi:hypothetical protein